MIRRILCLWAAAITRSSATNASSLNRPGPRMWRGMAAGVVGLRGRGDHPVERDERLLVEPARAEDVTGHGGGIVGLPDRQGVHPHDLPAKLGNRLERIVDLVVAREAEGDGPAEPKVVFDVMQVGD